MDSYIPTEPEEVTRNWIEKLLQVRISPPCRAMRVLSVTFEPATKPGDNFGSNIVRYRVVLVRGGRAEEVRLIGKFLPKAKEFREMLISGGVFQRELQAYINWAGAMRALPTIHGTRMQPPLPQILHGGINEQGCMILLEDLKASGFRMVDKYSGLSETETIMCLDALAKLHALSFAVQCHSTIPVEERFADLIELRLDESLESASRTKALIECVGELLKVVEGERYTSERFDAYIHKRDVSRRLFELSKTTRLPLQLILHGDCWTNNIMFRFGRKSTSGDEEPVEVKFVDLQAPRYAHCTGDLGYFFFTSVPGRLRRLKMKEFLKRYYEQLFYNLDLLMVTSVSKETYPFENFREDFGFFLELSFLNACVVLPFIFGKTEDIPDISGDFAMDEVVEMRRKQMQKCAGSPLADWVLDLMRDAVEWNIL